MRELESAPVPQKNAVMTLASAFERFTEEDLESREKLMESQQVFRGAIRSVWSAWSAYPGIFNKVITLFIHLYKFASLNIY